MIGYKGLVWEEGIHRIGTRWNFWADGIVLYLGFHADLS